MRGELVDLILDEVNVKEVLFRYCYTEKGPVDLVRKENRWEVQLDGKPVPAPRLLEGLVNNLWSKNEEKTKANN